MAQYQHGDAKQLTEHFKAREFQCKCGKAHTFLISDILLTKLETLYNMLGCDKVIITSGFRCTSHDKVVGGTGSGKHTEGTAADIMCYRDGKLLSSKIVCCSAQDVGFAGVANINKANTATHVDVASRKWYGDETVTTSKSVTDDFYKYYNMTKSDVYPDSPNTKNKIKVTVEIDGCRYTGILEED